MSYLHPTSTGGDGRIVPQRTHSKPGDKIVGLVHCYQCGMPFRVGIDTEGNSVDNAPSDTPVVTAVNNTSKTLPYLLQNNAAFLVSSVTTYDQSATNGCRFCHSMNPRGRGRNDGAFETGVDLSNR